MGGRGEKTCAVQGRHLQCMAQLGGDPSPPLKVYPQHSSTAPDPLCLYLTSLELSLPAALSLAPWLFPASCHRAQLSPCVPSSALQPLSVCRQEQTAPPKPEGKGELMLVSSAACWGGKALAQLPHQPPCDAFSISAPALTCTAEFPLPPSGATEKWQQRFRQAQSQALNPCHELLRQGLRGKSPSTVQLISGDVLELVGHQPWEDGHKTLAGWLQTSGGQGM